MPYGSGQRLGDTVRPELGRYDYSGLANAGQLVGQAFANAGQAVGQYQDNEKEIKKQQQVAKAIAKSFEGQEIGLMAQDALKQLENPELSQRDRLGIAGGISEALQIGVLAANAKRADAQFAAEMALKERELDMRGRGEGPPKLKPFDIPVPGGTIPGFVDDYGTQYTQDGKLFKASPYSGGGIAQEPALPDGGWEGTPSLPNDIQPAEPLGGYTTTSGRPLTPQGIREDIAPRGIGVLPQEVDEQLANAIRGAEAMVLPERGDIAAAQTRDIGATQAATGIANAAGVDYSKVPGFKPTEQKEADKPVTITLPDGSTSTGTWEKRNGETVFKPTLTKDGKPIIIPKKETEFDPDKAIASTPINIKLLANLGRPEEAAAFEAAFFDAQTKGDKYGAGMVAGQVDAMVKAIKPRDTSLQERREVLLEVADLMKQGKKSEALAAFNAVGLGGMFGKAASMDDLDSMYKGGTLGVPTNEDSKNTIREGLGR